MLSNWRVVKLESENIYAIKTQSDGFSNLEGKSLHCRYNWQKTGRHFPKQLSIALKEFKVKDTLEFKHCSHLHWNLED
jgi:hypothetical protein